MANNTKKSTKHLLYKSLALNGPIQGIVIVVCLSVSLSVVKILVVNNYDGKAEFK